MAAKKKSTKEECSSDGLALAAVTATASILANISQALGRAKLKAEKDELKNQRDRLNSVLREWQSAHNQLRMSYETRRGELDRARQLNNELQRTNGSQSKRILDLERKLAELRSEVTNAE